MQFEDKIKTKSTLNENWHGIIWAFLAALAASAMAVGVRGASYDIGTVLIAGYRLSIALVLIVILLAAIPAWRKRIQFSQPKNHIIRGIMMGISIHFGFYTIAHVPLAISALLFATAPIFTTIFNTIFLGETIGIRRISAIIIGFIGVIIVIWPIGKPFDFNVIYGIIASFIFGIALSMSRGLAHKDGALSTLLSSGTISLIITLPIVIVLIPADDILPNNLNTYAWLFGVTIFGLIRQFADIQSYRYAQAAVITPIGYSRIIFNGIAAYFLFMETPELNTYIGAVIIIGAIIYITYRERKKINPT